MSAEIPSVLHYAAEAVRTRHVLGQRRGTLNHIESINPRERYPMPESLVDLSETPSPEVVHKARVVVGQRRRLVERTTTLRGRVADSIIRLKSRLAEEEREISPDALRRAAPEYLAELERREELVNLAGDPQAPELRSSLPLHQERLARWRSLPEVYPDLQLGVEQIGTSDGAIKVITAGESGDNKRRDLTPVRLAALQLVLESDPNLDGPARMQLRDSVIAALGSTSSGLLLSPEQAFRSMEGVVKVLRGKSSNNRGLTEAETSVYAQLCTFIESRGGRRNEIYNVLRHIFGIESPAGQRILAELRREADRRFVESIPLPTEATTDSKDNKAGEVRPFVVVHEGEVLAVRGEDTAPLFRRLYPGPTTIVMGDDLATARSLIAKSSVAATIQEAAEGGYSLVVPEGATVTPEFSTLTTDGIGILAIAIGTGNTRSFVETMLAQRGGSFMDPEPLITVQNLASVIDDQSLGERRHAGFATIKTLFEDNPRLNRLMSNVRQKNPTIHLFLNNLLAIQQLFGSVGTRQIHHQGIDLLEAVIESENREIGVEMINGSGERVVIKEREVMRGGKWEREVVVEPIQEPAPVPSFLPLLSDS